MCQRCCTQVLFLIKTARKIKFTVVNLNNNDSCYTPVMNFNSLMVTLVLWHWNAPYHKKYCSKFHGQINTSGTSPYLFTLLHFPTVSFRNRQWKNYDYSYNKKKNKLDKACCSSRPLWLIKSHWLTRHPPVPVPLHVRILNKMWWFLLLKKC